jgi:hypothetical protein
MSFDDHEKGRASPDVAYDEIERIMREIIDEQSHSMSIKIAFLSANLLCPSP